MGLTSNLPAVNSITPDAAAAVAQTIANQNGIIDLREAVPVELYDKPKSTLITTKGRNAADNADKEVLAYSFNTDVYNTSVCTDGSGAGLASSFNDGFSGKNIQQHVRYSNGCRGLMIKSINFTAKDSAGDQDLSLLEALELTFLAYTVIGGRDIPKVLDISTAIRNTQFQSGVLTILFEVWINSLNQVSWIVGSGATITANLQWA